ncbi:MAG: magnesium transporter, partial [Firmicutes bacterium]|nr:magnesium transporter [Bacillota bacterium]
FDHIRKTGIEKETIYTCYVTTRKKLVGVVSVRDLLLSDYDVNIKDIMDDNVISVQTMDDKEEVANVLSKYDMIAVPVVDNDGRLVGIVTVDDAIDVLTEEATEDIEKMAAITPSEHPYLRSGVVEIWKQRIPWLLLLMVSATFTGMIITSFEKSLAAQVALTAFIPMLMDTGGNSGSQASVTIIRGLSLGDIEFSDILKVVWKEFRVSILCGISLSIVAFGKIMLVDHLLMHNDDITAVVAFVICAALALTVVIAKLVGCTLPLLAKKVGFDPAVMASPFITTIVDALSLMIYMNLASMILGI